MSYTSKFLLGLELDILFNIDIAKTFHKIIKIGHIFTANYKKLRKSVGFPSTIHMGTSTLKFILYQFFVKYTKIVMILHLREAFFFTCINISLLLAVDRVSKSLIYKLSFTLNEVLKLPIFYTGY